jgi:membrane protease subunit HflK
MTDLLTQDELTTTDGTPPPEGSRFGKAHHILLIFALAVFVIWLLTGFYQVKSDEVAIVERLGQYIQNPDGKAALVEQGLHYHMPWPIDTAHKVSVQQLLTLRVNAFDTSPDAYSEFKQQMMQQRQGTIEQINAVFDPYLITADKNVVHMDIAVVYRINDPEAWLNTISHTGDTANGEDSEDMRQQMFQQIAQHAMITRVSQMKLDEALFSGLGALNATMQETLEKGMQVEDVHSASGKLQLGVEVRRVDVIRSRPPDRVKSAYDQVQQSKANFQRMQRDALTQKESTIRMAESQKQTMLLRAEQYANEQTRQAEGEAARFSQVLKQFQQSPVSTRFNVFADTAQSIMANLKRLYVALPGQRITVTLDPPQFDANQVGPK